MLATGAWPCLHSSFWQSTRGASRLYRCRKSKQKWCSLSNPPFQHCQDVDRCLLEREIENAKRFCLEIQSECNKDHQRPTSSGEGRVQVLKVCYHLLTIYYIRWKMQSKHHLELQCKECSTQRLQRGPRTAWPRSLVLNQRLHFVDKVSGYPQDLCSIVVLSHF